MREDVKLGTWATIGDRCPMEHWVDLDTATLVLGSRSDGFEMVFSAVGLERFAELAGKALGEIREQEKQDAEAGA